MVESGISGEAVVKIATMTIGWADDGRCTRVKIIFGLRKLS